MSLTSYPPLSIMIKPVSGACNLNCSYCFYHHEVKQRQNNIHAPMKIETVKLLIDKVKDYPNKEVYIVFQGGEPLLRGIKFYKEIFEYSKDLNIQYSIQTNGLLLDEEYCKLFNKYNVLVGLSLDGRDTDNLLRITSEGTQSFPLVYKSLKLLQEKNVLHNCLTVVSQANIKNIKEIFEFFKENNERHLQFIPCLATKDKKYCLTSEQYGDYLIDLFECYFSSYMKNDFVSIRNMDNYLNMVAGGEPEQCGMNGRCSFQLVVESNGDLYPCDFYCLDKYFLGNISNLDFKKILANPKLNLFLKKKETPEKCKQCEFYMLCRGGCKRENEDFDRCPGTKRFFTECIDKFDIMLSNEKIKS